MKRGWIWVSVVMLSAVVIGSLSVGATSWTTESFDVGETIQFRIEQDSWGWWGCCGCCSPCNCQQEDVYVSGWRIEACGGSGSFAVIHDVPVHISSWQGSWNQVFGDGTMAASGYYAVYVETSAGTVSQRFRIVNPCCWTTSWCFMCDSCCVTPTVYGNCYSLRVGWVYPEPESCNWWPFCCPSPSCP